MAFDFPANPIPGEIYLYGTIKYQWNGFGWSRQGRGPGDPETAPPSDGDKGDVVVSGGGFFWVFDPAVVTTAGRAILDDPTAAAQRVTLGLGNVDNTSDANKPINAATQTALNNKYDKTGGTISGSATITGSATVNGAALVKADLAVSNGRIVNYGGGGNPEVSTYFLNQSGSKSLNNDGASLWLWGTPFRVANTTASINYSTGALVVGGGIGVGGSVFSNLNIEAVGWLSTRGGLYSENGQIWGYGYAGDNNQSVLWWNAGQTAYTHWTGTYWGFVGGRVNINDATEATAPTAAALTVVGGLGVAKAIRSQGLIWTGSTLQTTGLAFFGPGGQHYVGPLDVNTEAHYFGGGRGWVYNKSNGNVVWVNASGSGCIIYDSGVVEAKGFSTATGTFYTGGHAQFGTLGDSGGCDVRWIDQCRRNQRYDRDIQWCGQLRQLEQRRQHRRHAHRLHGARLYQVSYRRTARCTSTTTALTASSRVALPLPILRRQLAVALQPGQRRPRLDR